MEQVPFGSTGLWVSRLGYGAGPLGDGRIQDEDADRILHTVFDSGITLFDTARGYGFSEARIGRFVEGRRDQVVLSTKVGYDIPGYENWSPEIINAGITAALKALRTDVIDIVHLHSCPRDVLEHGGVVEALLKEKERGRIRVAAYSGDNDALEWVLAQGLLDAVQCSINLADQRAIQTALPLAIKGGHGVIAKRPLANAPWRFTERPRGEYCEEYWVRLQKMGLDAGAWSWPELAIRFAAFLPGVHSIIAGSTNLHHVQANVEWVQKGPLPVEIVETWQKTFMQHDDKWVSQV